MDDRTDIRVQVARDKMSAELILPITMETSHLSVQMCELVLNQAHVLVNRDVSQAIKELIEHAQSHPGEEARAVVVRGKNPEPGIDGRIEWTVQPPAQTETEQATDDSGKQVSHYDRSVYIVVETGQVLGKRHLPTPGEDGYDVHGNAMPTREGREVELKHDESIMIDARGQILAQATGVLHRDASGLSASIKDRIEVDQFVDFSTGNIDFSGDVLIKKGIRDNFEVKADGTVEVLGMIEAATIITGKDLLARGGFAGREKGHAHVGHDLEAKYLDGVIARIRNDLRVEREAINCQIEVNGNMNSPNGSIIGGSIAVAGVIHIATLGSEGGTATTLRVNVVPRLDPMIDELQVLVDGFTEKRQALLDEQNTLQMLSGSRAAASNREKLTELMFEVAEVQTMIDKSEPVLRRLVEKADAVRRIEIHVTSRMHRGLVIVANGLRYVMKEDLRGPFVIRADRQGKLVVEADGGTPQQLSRLAELRDAA